MDPWYGLGTADMLDVAHMAVHAVPMTSREAIRWSFDAVTEIPARIMGLEGFGLRVGANADFVLLQAADPIEAVRLRPPRLAVVRRGKVVARTPACTSALSLPGRGQALTAAGLLLVAASLARPLARWRGTATLAAVAAIAGSALGHPGTGLLAAEGLLILGYLLLTDAPAAMPGRVAARWLRLQVPAAAWAALVSAAVVLGLSVQVGVSAWLVVAGATAAVAATVIALPWRSRQPPEPR